MFGLTPRELRGLIGLKHSGNMEFHINKTQMIEQAIQELSSLDFPRDLEVHKFRFGTVERFRINSW
jgi:hypothetical protein